ncbi:MAG: hypothetical protein K5929_05060 [Lachnospiraceae bacterium]|nr:hypothetical protein [Lachnospiraceae bacterium]
MNQKKIMKYGLFCTCAALTFTVFSPADVNAATEDTLRSKIKGASGYDIVKDYYADFDGDGAEEMFAVVENDDMGGGEQLWFANDSMSKCLYDDGNSLYCFTEEERICRVSEDQQIFIMEMGGYGSGSSSLCCYLQDGEVICRYASEGLTHVKGAEFTIHPSAFDNYVDSFGFGTGHTYKPYYIKWTGDAFTEYTAKKISLKKFKKYTGAKKYIRKIKKEGYTIDSILLRSNGIIHVNIHQDDEYDGTSYDNVNFELKGKSVKLIKIDPNVKGVVASSSHGGVYAASGF